jgi:glycosyltransferase involved in cell wall biosynthesis
LDVAEKCPGYDFVVVGGGDKSDPYVRDVLGRARRISNVTVLGRIPDAELWQLYARADLLVDTAAIAGVPTTFLEAWAHGVPVVSTVALDGILEENNIGLVVSNVTEMVQAISAFVNDVKTWELYSRSARAYYEKHHTVEAVSAQYDRLVQSMNAAKGAGTLGYTRPAKALSA